ncbi:epithelial splicing regulatory protein 2-like isoform X2 [Symsagittifera roscoffensis]|uniref:epithelial splicing regulatory protein 2-like isoform X2 n=1 Tax=Symsagittifera roscoffensis TaxID=84072 RepID=UPI00307B1493
MEVVTTPMKTEEMSCPGEASGFSGSDVSHTIFLCYHCATPGSPEDWGSETEELVAMSWTCIDSSTNQVVGSKHLPVRTSVNEFCVDNYLQIGFTHEQALNAKPLPDILRELHQYMITELLPESSSKSLLLACPDGDKQPTINSSPRGGHVEVVPVTVGPGPIRQALHAETTGKNMDVPDYFYRYVDILQEYNEQFGCNLSNIVELAQMLNYNLGELNGSGQNESYVISIAVSKLLSEKGLKMAPLSKKQVISKRLETVPCTKEEMVCEDTVIKVRGLPWQSSDQDVAQFFRGLDIARGGVALCLNPQGRRNGEALVRFNTTQHRDMALMRHKRHMGNRYIEVYKSSPDDFMKIAADPNNEAIGFLSHGDNIIIKMRGLPFTATAEDVTEFFGADLPIVAEKEGILFVKYPDGRSTGDAFVQFETEDMAKEALKLHKTNIRDRYIELFRSTAAEVVQVMKRFSNPPLLPNGPPGMNGSMPPIPNLNGPHQMGHLGLNPNLAALHNLLPFLLPPSSKSCLLLRNLPLCVKVEDIITFLGEHAEWIRPAGIHMVLNQQGRPSGDCFIQMHSDVKAAAAALFSNAKFMSDHKVHVTQCSPEEMNTFFVEGTISPPTAVTSPQVLPFPNLFPNVFNPATTSHLAAANALLAPALKAAAAAQQQVANAHLAPPHHHPIIPTSAAAAAMFMQQHNPTYQQLTPPVSPHNSIYGQPNFTAVKMKGLPVDATVQDVMTFFSDYIIPEHAIQPVINQHGKATGECSVMFWSPEIAKQVVAEKNNSQIRSNVIELVIL